MAKILSKVKVFIGQGVAPAVLPGADVFDSIGNLSAASGPELSKDDIEITDMESIIKEFLGDLANPGNVNFTAFRNIGDAGQEKARADAQLQIQRNIRLEFLNPADSVVLETIDFIGEVMEFTTDATQASPLSLTGRIKISGALTIT